ncbi:MAG: hypothetical protein ACUVRF_10570, partial [Desulfotomaculales bacterium]
KSTATARGKKNPRVYIQALLALVVHDIRQLVRAVGRKRKRAARVQALAREIFVLLRQSILDTGLLASGKVGNRSVAEHVFSKG